MIVSRRPVSGLTAGLMAALLVGLTGCGASPAMAQGIVTFDGIPVESGSIKFISEADPKQTPAVGLIKDGRYEVAADRGLTAGRYKVEIIWTKNVPANKNAPPKKVDPDATTPESKLGDANSPNRTSNSTADVKAGANPIDFPLSSK